MDAIELSRIQFGCTAAFHFLFVPLTLGLIALIVLMETAHLITRDTHWQTAARFWGRFFVINFVFGVATGYPLRLQLQENWSAYSATVQPVFQAIFDFEGYLAPFLFGLVLLFAVGWRLKPVWHWLASLALALVMVAQASSILALNAWMQYPVGVEFVAGRAQLISATELFANPLLAVKVMHTLAAAWVLGSTFVVAISAWYVLRRRHLELARRSMSLAVGFGLAALLATAVMGHFSGERIARYQPMKFAALEGLWQSEPAPAPLTLLAWPDMASAGNRFELRLPYVLGWLVGDSAEAPLAGIRDLAYETARQIALGALAAPGAPAASGDERLSVAQYQQRHGYAALLPDGVAATPEPIARAAGAAVPPVPAVFWAFRLMAGCWLLLFGLFAYLAWPRPNAAGSTALRLCLLALPLPWIAIEAGWVVCELGRQPWTVAGVLPTARSGGDLTPQQVATTLAAFAAAYALLLGINLALTLRAIKAGPLAPLFFRRCRCAAAGDELERCAGRDSCAGCVFALPAK